MTLTIEEFEKNWAAFQEGKISSDEIASLRTLYGIYTLRGLTDHFMVRIKVPAGILSPRRLNAVASVMDRFASFRQAHVTTRQDVEIYGVQGLHLPVMLKMLSSAGLTTFCSGGNSVRNVTCCPLAGVAPEESFDVTPYAMAASEYFLSHRAYKRLPRKIKIAFEGCAEDHAKVGIQDLGVHAALDGHDVDATNARPALRIRVPRGQLSGRGSHSERRARPGAGRCRGREEAVELRVLTRQVGTSRTNYCVLAAERA
jgi:ferredoxin-nitrite reductase/sulfite reductase (ferredoxin)